MANERSEHKPHGFWFLFEKFNKDLKGVNVKKLLLIAQLFFCTGSTLLPQIELKAWFHFILLPERSKTLQLNYFGTSNDGRKQ